MCVPNYVGPTGESGCYYIPEPLKEAHDFYSSILNIPKSVQRRETLMKGDEDGLKEE